LTEKEWISYRGRMSQQSWRMGRAVWSQRARQLNAWRRRVLRNRRLIGG